MEHIVAHSEFQLSMEDQNKLSKTSREVGSRFVDEEVSLREEEQSDEG
jgi:hypothetical protein